MTLAYDMAVATNKAREEGISQGAREAKLETAKILKAANVPLNLIADSTGLSAEEINKL